MSDPGDAAIRRAIAALPDDVEERALAALECDDRERDRAIARLLAEHPDHASALRRWLTAAGVPVPPAPAGGEHGGEHGGAAEDGDATDDAGAADGPGDPHAVPRRIGPYRILRVLGRGGFGTVYLAAHGEPRSEVAIKVLNPGMDSGAVLRRFAAEREALQRLDHPGIARLLGDGTTGSGRPYFVMEHVPGDTLALHCRRRDLPLRERLDLFLQVLDAVAYAHRQGIIHRDLSSNNVLVAAIPGRPQPKIIDFGVAKSLAVPLQDGGTLTFQGTLMGTPEYMSPEQAQGRIEAIDTRADIYSLGVQLYELLCDQLPIPGVVLRSQGIAGMARVIATHEPSRPSQVAPPHRQAALRGDLDWIALKALAKDREQRYATVSEFAADLHRHRDHQPVLARKPGTWYLLRKFARRHRAQVAVAALLLAALVGALSLSLFLWRQTAFAQAELQRVHDELTARADAGFRLLANEERLRAAMAAAGSFDPPWPERAPAMRAWFADYAAPLGAEQPKLAQKRAELRARALGERSADPADAHLLAAIERLDAELQRFFGPDGTVEAVRRRLSFATEVVAPSLERHAADWQGTARAIERTRGWGWHLDPQPGLVPLGRNPATGLWEFLDLHSHPRDAEMPAREQATGALRCGPSTGIVFVLVPGGTFRLGAQRSEPGLPQNDPQARDDELRGPTVMLSEFFVARTELTRAQLATLRGEAVPSDPSLPATDLDWHTAVDVLRRHGMALPTEAQWEYACRAGTATPWWTGGDRASAAAVGHFDGALHPAGGLPPSPFGLHDVHGNAGEWCADWKLPYELGSFRSGDGLHVPPAGSPEPERRAVRGGGITRRGDTDLLAAARATARASQPPAARERALGVRPVRTVRRR